MSGPERYVKLGRIKLLEGAGIPSHWAVGVGFSQHWTWFEIELPDTRKKEGKRTKIVKNCGNSATSGAGILGGEIVGKTRKTDAQIEDFIGGYKEGVKKI